MRGCLLVIVGTVVGVALFVWIVGGGDQGGPKDYEIEAVAQVAVLKFLKSPASAEFDIASVHPQPDGMRWAVVGNVDSQNSFGAMIRSPYIAVVRNVCQKTYRTLGCLTVDKLSLDGQVVLK